MSLNVLGLTCLFRDFYCGSSCRNENLQEDTVDFTTGIWNREYFRRLPADGS